MRYRCLILDHDDTAVDSTREIHYPAHLEVMRRLRPGHPTVSLEEWYRKNFHPGIMDYLVGELAMSEEELEMEFSIWREYTASRMPRFFPGFIEILEEFRSRGGRIAVVSHSERELIERDYLEGPGHEPFAPDLVFGWDRDERRRKPSPWPVERILETFGVDARDALIVDDLKPAVLMGEASGVEVAAAGWSHDIPEIRSYMERRCTAYLETVTELGELVLG